MHRATLAFHSALLALFTAGMCFGKESSTRPLPAAPHSQFGQWRWTSEPHRYPGTGSDMHWWTWAKDGSLIVVDEDGQNFGNPWSFGHVLRVTGTPPNHHVEEIAVLNHLGLKDGIKPDDTYTENLNARGFSRYVGGVAAVGDRLYIGVYDYTWDVPGLRPDMKDLYSANGGLLGFLVSDDGGLTWKKLFKDGDKHMFGHRFTALQFISWGPGGTGTPASLGADYLYGVSNDSNWESGDNLFLARVKKDAPEKRSSWEFFAGVDKNQKAKWTTDEEAAQPILSDKGHIGHSTVSYNPVRKAYWLAVFSDTIPHRIDTPAHEAHTTWDTTAELQIYEGPNPWGPWKLLHNEQPWYGTDHAPYLPMIPTPWIDSDGNGGVILFSGDYVRHKHAWYGFMTQRFRIGPTPQPADAKAANAKK